MNSTTQIETFPISNNTVKVPIGLNPVWYHKSNDRHFIHVIDWSASKEFDATQFELYQLDEARRVGCTIKSNDHAEPRTFYMYPLTKVPKQA